MKTDVEASDQKSVKEKKLLKKLVVQTKSPKLSKPKRSHSFIKKLKLKSKFTPSSASQSELKDIANLPLPSTSSESTPIERQTPEGDDNFILTKSASETNLQETRKSVENLTKDSKKSSTKSAVTVECSQFYLSSEQKGLPERTKSLENLKDMPAYGELILDENYCMSNATTITKPKDHLYKILVIGDLGTGKTSIIKRYVHRFFTQHYRATIGVDFALKVLNWDDNTLVRLQLWDIAGQERYGNMTRVYYKEAVGAFIVFDVTRRNTFESVANWKNDLDSKVQLPDGSSIPCVLLANKTPNFSLQWENLTVEVTEKQYGFLKTIETKKLILDNVSGCAYNNSLIAIMGPSGSGKTTFLGAISGRIKGKEGVIKINNKIVKNKDISNISGYIQQEDMFTETLTVYEHMKFMTALRLNKTRQERDMKIKKLLTELNLETSRHTIVRMLSGGERRRLTLATELINDPYILMCDEPTTGLDSFSAMSVVQKLEATAMTGKLVLVTLHQPSSQIFNLFNNIILLANGKLIFEGPTQQARLFFERAHLYCPVAFNPADFYIKCVTIEPGEEEKGEKEISRLSELFDKDFRKIHNLQHLHYFNGHWKENVSKKNFFIQLRWLTWRVLVDSKRNFYRYWTSYVALMVTALIISISFSNVKLEGSSSIQNIQGALTLMISEMVFAHMYYVIYIFPEEVDIFVREKSLYSAYPYVLSKVLSLIPLVLIDTISFSLIYFIILEFFQGFQLFLGIFTIVFVTSLCGICFGLCMSALFPTVEYLDLFIVPCEMTVMLLSGIWIKIDTLPKFFGIIKYFSPFYFGLQAVSTLYWEEVDQLANCTMDAVPPCYKYGQGVLIQYGFLEDYDVIAFNSLCLFILMLVYSFIGYLGIVRKRALINLY